MSNQTKHTPTPGPWTAEEGRSIAAIWDTGEHVQIACMSGSRWSTDPRHDDVELNRSRNERMYNEQEANVRLIAACPELLQALVDLQREVRSALKFDVKKHYSLMVADVAASKAIEKAGGQ